MVSPTSASEYDVYIAKESGNNLGKQASYANLLVFNGTDFDVLKPNSTQNREVVSGNIIDNYRWKNDLPFFDQDLDTISENLTPWFDSFSFVDAIRDFGYNGKMLRGFVKSGISSSVKGTLPLLIWIIL